MDVNGKFPLALGKLCINNIVPYINGLCVFNATFNNMSVIHVSWCSVLLMEETEIP